MPVGIRDSGDMTTEGVTAVEGNSHDPGRVSDEIAETAPVRKHTDLAAEAGFGVEAERTCRL